MSLEEALRTAVQHASAGRESFLHYTFETSRGSVEFYSQVELDQDMIVCKNVCIYPESDPLGIERSTITKELLREFRFLRLLGQKLGYAGLNVRGIRSFGSSSAKPGKIVNILRRRKRDEQN